MLKARGQAGDGAPVVFLGLTGETVTRLVAGDPVLVNLRDLGMPPCHVVLNYGRDNQALLDQMSAHGIRVNTGPGGAPPAG